MTGFLTFVKNPVIVSKNGRFMGGDEKKIEVFANWEKMKDCARLPESKNELAINIMENGDYALEFIMNGQPRAVAHMKPAEAEQFALAILADIQNRQKSPERTTTDETTPEIRGT